MNTTPHVYGECKSADNITSVYVSVSENPFLPIKHFQKLSTTNNDKGLNLYAYKMQKT